MGRCEGTGWSGRRDKDVVTEVIGRRLENGRNALIENRDSSGLGWRKLVSPEANGRNLVEPVRPSPSLLESSR